MSNLSTVYIKDYSGGLNDSSSAREIKRNEASVLQNWDITYQGQLRRRSGLTLIGNAIGANPIQGLHAFLQPSNTTQDLVCFEGANIRYLNSTTWDTLDSTSTLGHRMWMETVFGATDRLFLTNEDNELRYWDRSSTTLNTCLTTVGAGTSPHGNVMRWHKNHLFHINNVKIGATLYQHDVFWSDMGDPLTYDTANNHFTVPGNGRAISMIDLGDNLIIFKEHAIQHLSGWGSNSWKITASSSNVANLSEQVGMIAPYGATRVGNEAWFIDDEGFIRRVYQTDTDAFRKDIISSKIQGTLSQLNKGSIKNAVAWTNDNKVYFAIPLSTNSYNALVCVADLLAMRRTNEEAWTTYTGWYPSFFTAYPTNVTPELYIGDALTGKVYKHTGVSDNGVAIDARWDGKDDDFDKPERYKRYKFGYSSGISNSNVRVSRLMSIDSGPFATLDPLDLTVSGSRLGPTGSFLLGPTGNARLSGATEITSKFFFSSGGGAVRGRLAKPSIRHNRLNEQPTVNGITMHYKERELR